MENLSISDLPISVQFNFQSGIFTPSQQFVNRRVSDLAEMFSDQQAVQQIIKNGDRLVYDIQYYAFMTSTSDMALGVTRIYPGKVGEEYHMTKGHFHERDDQPEIYFCVQGTGHLLMETAEGEFYAHPWKPGTITHIPPMFAHRVVNTGSEPLYFVASYHISAGHSYELISSRGFSQIVVEREGQAVLVSNPIRERL
jgi:glucose-6-phosphate isomerase